MVSSEETKSSYPSSDTKDSVGMHSEDEEDLEDDYNDEGEGMDTDKAM